MVSPIAPLAAIAWRIGFVSSVFMVTSMPTSVILAPDRITICAASGSFQKLASAIGVGIPWMPGWWIVPPMMTTSLKSGATSGALAKAIATLVTGPTGQSVISPGLSRARRIIKSLAGSATGLAVG